MASSQMLTVRVADEDLEKLDQLAALQGRARSQLVQEALADLIRRSDEIRNLEIKRLRKRLRPAISEQCSILDDGASFADEHRSF